MHLHALASLILQAQQLLPDAVDDTRDQGYTWAEIGQLLNLAPNRRPALPDPGRKSAMTTSTEIPVRSAFPDRCPSSPPAAGVKAGRRPPKGSALTPARTAVAFRGGKGRPTTTAGHPAQPPSGAPSPPEEINLTRSPT